MQTGFYSINRTLEVSTLESVSTETGTMCFSENKEYVAEKSPENTPFIAQNIRNVITFHSDKHENMFVNQILKHSLVLNK